MQACSRSHHRGYLRVSQKFLCSPSSLGAHRSPPPGQSEPRAASPAPACVCSEKWALYFPTSRAQESHIASEVYSQSFFCLNVPLNSWC